MDPLLHALPLKRETSPYEKQQDVFSQPPPTRAAPPAPHGDVSGEGTRDDVVPEYTSQAWDNGPPSRMPPIPNENFDASGDGNHNRSLSSNIQLRYTEIDDTRAPRNLEQNYIQNHNRTVSRQGSPTVPETYTPPPRTSSGSPRTLEYRRPRAESLAPTQSLAEHNTYRSVSTPLNSRPNSQVYHSDGDNDMGNKDKRKSFMGLGLFQSQSASEDDDKLGIRAWTIPTDVNKSQQYGLDLLMRGEVVPELWESDDAANLYVYFYPSSSGRGPQVKCRATAIQSSKALLELAQETHTRRNRARSFDGRGSLSIEDATRNLAVQNPSSPPLTPQLSSRDPQSASDGSDSIKSFPSNVYPPGELHLYLPLGNIDPQEGVVMQDNGSSERVSQRQANEQKLIEARNLFAFLSGQVIVATKQSPSAFRCFLDIAKLLNKFGFSDSAGASFGPAAEFSFKFYMDTRHIADVRESREKTLEGLILGEAMKSGTLYNEAFAHAVGKYEDVKSKRSPLEDELSAKTRQSIERGSLQLRNYKIYVDGCLTDFDFPSVFSGIANSTSREESKMVRFKNWKSNFMALRKAVLSYYKQLHGSWPPKASSKKNAFIEGGLNRLVLKGLYHDVCSLYDFLVDRDNVTTRAIGAEMKDNENQEPAITILRKLLGEFDKSTTWETPPIPLDVPHLPSLLSADPHFARQTPKEQEKATTKRKLKDYEAAAVLEKGHNNVDGLATYKSDFITMYRLFEKKEAKGKTTRELQEQRIGHWIFLYCVIQVLPLLISDAPNLQFTDGVEYFLSATPPESLPWVARSTTSGQYQTISGHIGYAPVHQLKYGITSIYERSHCWERARVWLSHDEAEDGGSGEGLSPLSPPPSFMAEGGLRGRRSVSGPEGFLSVGEAERSGSRGRLSDRMSWALGLESMPRVDREESAVSRPTSAAVRTPPERDVTFDDILAGTDLGGDPRRRGR